MKILRVVTVAGDPEREASFAGLLGSRPDVELVLRCVDRVESLAAIRGASLDAVIAVGDPHWFDRQAAREAATAGIRLVSLVDDPLEAARMRDLGAAVIAPTASVDEVVRACMSAPIPLVQPEKVKGGGSGRLITVWGPKGSPGRTSIAIELAEELASSESPTLLVDGDTYGGDVLQLLGITEELPSIVWAARMAAKGELERQRLFTDLRRTHAAGPVVLPGIPRADLWAEISEFGWKELLDHVTAAFAFAVCDVGFCFEPNPAPYSENAEGRNRLARAALRESNATVAVFRADPLGIKNFLWAFDDLRNLIDPDRIVLVANRVVPGEEREVSDLIRRYTHRRVTAFVPDAPIAFAEASAKGRTMGQIRGGAAIVSGIRSVAEAMGASIPAAGLLTRLSGRS